ncbi:MAG TPA: hypothetical protein VKC64_10245 [Burkholderiales bacterium]|nr:hypothetical protein [Burkholderiales bacterium]
MSAEVIKLVTPHAGRLEHAADRPRSERAVRSGFVTALLAGASIVIIACGIVAAVLWFVWMLAEVIP